MGDSDDLRPLSEGLQGTLDRIAHRLSDDPPAAEAAPPIDDPRESLSTEPAGPAAAEDAKVFTPRLFTQLALPYRNPGNVPSWVRRNGALELIVRPGRVVDPASGQRIDGFPYGVVPRLLVIWMASEVLKHKERRELVLGPSLGGFLATMGLTRGGTQAARVRDQMTRLFGASVTVEAITSQAGAISGWTMENVTIARSAQLWWHDSRPQDPLWESTVVLSEEFHESIVDKSVPLDGEALARLRTATRSPLALDIYAWLAHRLRRVQDPTIARWPELAVQFGGDYERLRDFKRDFLKELTHVRAVYPAAKVAPEKAGLRLWRSAPPVQDRQSAIR